MYVCIYVCMYNKRSNKIRILAVKSFKYDDLKIKIKTNLKIINYLDTSFDPKVNPKTYFRSTYLIKKTRLKKGTTETSHTFFYDTLQS